MWPHRLTSVDYVGGGVNTAGYDSLFLGKCAADEKGSRCYAEDIEAQHCS